MCGIVGYVGAQQAAPLLLEGLGRLEHRGYDSAGVAVLGPGKESPAAGGEEGRPGARPDRAAAQAVRRQGRHRPHPVGDPRAGERRQRAPARRHQGRRRRRAQRDHRQRRRAAGRAGRRRRRPGLRHRHRGARAPDRPLGGRDPGGQGGRGAGPGRGHLRAGGPARGVPGPDRGGPQRQPADHRHRRPRDVRRLRPGRAGPLHDPGGAPRRRRAGHDHRRRVHDVPPGPQPRWRGAATEVEVDPAAYDAGRARRRSCTRRCSSSPRPPSGCCAAGSTSGSAPRTSAASRWTRATCARSAG